MTAAADVANEASVVAAANAAASRFGGLHAVVNSAGISLPKRFEDITAQEFDNVMKINVLGSRNAVFACLPHIKRAGGGRIVLVSVYSRIII